MNKPKYFILNGDSCVAVVYQSDKYGRTLVIQDKFDANDPIQIFSHSDGIPEKVTDIDLIEFIQSMLPVD